MTRRWSTVGGCAFLASGALFLTRDALEWVMGPPPATGTAILDWAASNRLLLSLTSETFVFAAVLLIPSVLVLRRTLVRPRTMSAAFGCAILGITIPVHLVMAVVHGRLMYPVFGIKAHTPEIAELVVAVYYGGRHLTALLFAAAALALGIAMRERFGRRLAYASYATAALSIAGSFPDAIGSNASFVVNGFGALWLAGVGRALLATRRLAPVRVRR